VPFKDDVQKTNPTNGGALMMKSAYELAMERLEQSDPDHQPLKPEQREKLAQIDQLYEAKLAEKEVFRCIHLGDFAGCSRG